MLHHKLTVGLGKIFCLQKFPKKDMVLIYQYNYIKILLFLGKSKWKAVFHVIRIKWDIRQAYFINVCV